MVNIEELTRLEQEINEKTKQLEEIRSHSQEEKSRSHDEIKPEHIAQVVSRWSGIPLNHIAGSEASRF